MEEDRGGGKRDPKVILRWQEAGEKKGKLCNIVQYFAIEKIGIGIKGYGKQEV